MKYFPRILHYLRPYWRLAVTSVFITLLAVGASLLAPWPFKILIDNVLGNHPPSDLLAPVFNWLGSDRFNWLLFVVVAGLGVVLIDNLLTVLHNYVTTKLEQRMALDFRGDLFEHAQHPSMPFHDQRRSGVLIYAINSQADSVPGVLMALQPMAQSVLTLIGMFWIAYNIDSTLALLSLTVVPFLYYSVGYYARHIQARLMRVKTLEGETLSIIHEAVSMMRVIVTFGREKHEYRRFREQGERAVAARVRLTVRQTVFSLVVNTITAIGTALVLGVGAYHVIEGKLTLGDLTVIMGYIAAVYSPLEAISTQIGQLQDHFVSLRIAFDLLDTKPEIQDAPIAARIGRAKGDVAYERVGFAYSGRVDTLKNISFKARAGQVVAIVGPTGAGKTTLISLLPRLYDRNEGRILLDGRDIRDIKLKSLRDQISIVLQEPLLFSTSIAENIRYGRLEATMDEIIEAAKAANAHDFVMALPNQYDTILGERGSMLSGGERQRISVARAFLKDAPILILDEPTSSIDSKTEAVILDALDRLMEGRTTFMIAHRLSTIRHSDLILVLNHGELVDQGTHEELLQRGGLYKQLHEMQIGQIRRKSLRKLQPFIEEPLETQTAVAAWEHHHEPVQEPEQEPEQEPVQEGIVVEEPERVAVPLAPMQAHTLSGPLQEVDLDTFFGSPDNGYSGYGQQNGSGAPEAVVTGDGVYRVEEPGLAQSDMDQDGTNRLVIATTVESSIVVMQNMGVEEPGLMHEGITRPAFAEQDATPSVTVRLPVEPLPATQAPVIEDLNTLQNLLISNPREFGAYLALASAYARLGHLDSALTIYRQALKIPDLQPFVLDVIAENLVGFTNQFSGNPKLHLVRGDLYIQQGRYLDAVQEYNIMMHLLARGPR